MACAATAEGLYGSDGCAEEPISAPAADPAQNCPGNDQICPGAACPDVEGAFCTTNDQPGIPGCMGACQTDDDCPAGPSNLQTQRTVFVSRDA